jgi:hypothetical protein
MDGESSMPVGHQNRKTKTGAEGRPEEEFAFAVVRRVLGVPVEGYDKDGRQGAVDALVHHPEGPPAALEVSSIGPESEAGILNFLSKRGYSRAVRGLSRTWELRLPRAFHPADIRLAERALLWCDARGITRVSDAAGLDADVNALLSLGGHAHILDSAASGTTGTQTCVHIYLSSVSGAPGHGAETLSTEVAAILNTDRIRSKIAKLAATGLAERHLLLIVRPLAFSYPVYDALAFGGPLPDQPPCLPTGLSQLWLVTGFREGGVVRAIAEDSWSRDQPFDL